MVFLLFFVWPKTLHFWRSFSDHEILICFFASLQLDWATTTSTLHALPHRDGGILLSVLPKFPTNKLAVPPMALTTMSLCQFLLLTTLKSGD